MLAHGLGEGTEDDAEGRELVLEGRRHRHAVDDGVHGDAREDLALLQGHAELLVHGDELGIHVRETLRRPVLRGLRGGVVDDLLVVDSGVGHARPFRLGHREPVPVGLEPPFEQPLGLTLLAGDEAHDVLREAGRDALGIDVGDEAVLVFLLGEGVEDGVAHGAFLLSGS